MNAPLALEDSASAETATAPATTAAAAEIEELGRKDRGIFN